MKITRKDRSVVRKVRERGEAPKFETFARAQGSIGIGVVWF